MLEVIFLLNKEMHDAPQSIPVGLEIAMAQNPDPLNYFGNLDPSEYQSVFNYGHTAQAQQSMSGYLNEENPTA